MVHFLVDTNGILSQLSEMVQHLYLGWKNKGSRAPNIFNPFYFKIHAVLNHSKLTFFTHPNIKIGKNDNVPKHRRGFHVFFKNSCSLFTHLRPDIKALVYCGDGYYHDDITTQSAASILKCIRNPHSWPWMVDKTYKTK